MIDWRKDCGLRQELNEHSHQPGIMAKLCERVQAGFDVFERSKQALNEDNFAAALERNTLREFRTEELRQDAQRALMRKQMFLRLHYLGAWLQIALTMGQLEALARKTLKQEERILTRAILHEDEEEQTHFFLVRHQIAALPLASLHTKWLSLQDQVTMAKCIKSTLHLYELCVSSCNDPAEGVPLPKLPFNFLKFEAAGFDKMEYMCGGVSFRYYCGTYLQNVQPDMDVSLGELRLHVKNAYAKLTSKRAERTRTLAFINPQTEAARFESFDLQTKAAESQCENDFKSAFDKAARLAEETNSFTGQLSEFIGIVRVRQKYIRDFQRGYGQSAEWLASMYTMVVAVLTLHQRKLSEASWSEVRDSKYAPVRQELARRLVIDMGSQIDARLAFVEALDRKTPLANEVIIVEEAA